jgi:hypothetical protein
MNSDHTLKPVFIQNQATTITVDSTIVLTSSFDGGGNTYLHGPNLGDKPLFNIKGSGVTLSNAIIDDNNFSGVSGAVRLSGDGNSIKYCTLNNCVRYGFYVASATDFYIGYNTINKAQHGISGATGGGNSYWGVDGVIEHNTVRGMIIQGIKLKAFRNVVVRYNYVDTTPLYGHNPIGICFNDDAPSVNVIVENNTVEQTAPGVTAFTYGVYAGKQPSIVDPEVAQTGNVIRNNHIIDIRYGITLYGNNFTVYGNEFTGVSTPIRDYGTGNVIND